MNSLNHQNDFKHHYIDGQWTSGQGSVLESFNPADGTLLWAGTMATEHEVQSAFEAARQALKSWSVLDVSDRIKYLEQFSRQVELRRDDLTHLIAKESGKPLWEASTEVSAVIGKVALSIKAYFDRTGEQKISPPDTNGFVRYKPHGVVAVLGPFNFPAHLSNGHIVPALLAGNTVVYKPSELTPAVAALIMQCWHESGLPSGVLNLIQGNLESAKMLLNQDIQGVYFTGSYRAGLEIHQTFAKRPEVILALEMGGNNPLVIESVQNQAAALYQTLLSAMITAGQRCTCARRIILPNTQNGDEFLEKFINGCRRIQIGPYTQEPEPFIGPVISHQHALAHLKAQTHLIQLGGEPLLTMQLLSQGTGFLSPGVIEMSQVDNPPDEEIFAPFVQVYRYDDFDEAIAIANKTQYGLSAGLFSDHQEQFNRFYQNIRAGLINWNKPTTGALSSLPFGGVGHSGNHRPSAYYAADYCAYPIATLVQPCLSTPEQLLPGIELT